MPVQPKSKAQPKRRKYGWNIAAMVLGFAMVMALMVSLLAIGHSQVSEAERLREQQGILDRKIRLVYDMRDAIRERTFHMAIITTYQDFFDRYDARNRFDSVAAKFANARESLIKLNLSAEESKAIDDVQAEVGNIRPFVEEMMNLALEDGMTVMNSERLAEAMTRQASLVLGLNDLVELQLNLRDRRMEALRTELSTFRANMEPVAIGLLFLAALISIFVIRGQRRLVEELVEARENADSANHSKSAFLANMSHELRTPLNAVIGFSETMKSQIFGPLGNEKYEEYVGLIAQSGMHLLELVNDILDLSEVEVGEIVLEREEVEIIALVDECIDLLRPRANDEQVVLSNALAVDFPRLNVDPRRIRQVIINLLGNAIKFTPTEGFIKISGEIDAQGWVRISVSDTGIGMDPKDIPRALQPFEQIDRGAFTKHEGTGLGLPLCLRLAQLHDGDLVLTSERNHGTTATLVLPPEAVV